MTWKPRKPNGALGGPVDVYLTPGEVAELRAVAVRMRALPEGEERSRLLNEICTRLDIHAYFPGT